MSVTHRAPTQPAPAVAAAERGLDLLLFAGDARTDAHAVEAGYRRFVVDWEWRGKDQRQSGTDTEINHHTPATLRRLRAIRASERWCRLNRSGPWTPEEVETALEAGATHVLLPMVEHPREAEQLVALIAGRACAGILVETVRACEHARDLAQVPLGAVYVGLNDLAISRGGRCIFDAVADGTVEWLRGVFHRPRFGFGGMTVLDGGRPVPARLLLGEMARLDCDFTFLRRSFKRDIAARDWPAERAALADEWRALRARGADQVSRDRLRLCEAIRLARG